MIDSDTGLRPVRVVTSVLRMWYLRTNAYCCVLVHVTELTDRPFELLGSQTEHDRDQDMQVDTADSLAKSGVFALVLN